MKDNKKFWDRVAKLYTPIQEKSNLNLFKAISEDSLEFIKDKLVLEIACGTGQITTHLSYLASKYYATDYSDKMCDETIKRKISNAIVEKQDATNLSYMDNSFDVVIIANALHIMPNPESALIEIRRVLKPNGILIAPTFVYEGKVNKIRLFLIKIAGFKTYNKWNKKEYESFILNHKFETIKSKLIDADPIPEALIIAKNIK